jgi:outer membrane protein TolC
VTFANWMIGEAPGRRKRLCSVFVMSAAMATGARKTRAQQPEVPEPPKPAATYSQPNAPVVNGLFQNYILNYTQGVLPAMTFEDSKDDPKRAALLESGGEIKLTLHEAIALAIENNLDIESVRLLDPMARADLARARSGELLRSVPTSVAPGLTSATGSLATATALGFEGSAVAPNGATSVVSVPLNGSAIPSIEPVLFATGKVDHTLLPLPNPFFTGTNELNQSTQDWQLGVRKGFFTGTTLTTQFESLRTKQNAPNDTINPSLQANVFLRVDQHLLQGFDRRTNRRAIYIGLNDKKIADLTFRQQVILTVSQVMGLYYDLVEFREQKKIIEASLERRRKLLEDSRKRLDLGLISQADVVSAEISVANAEQASNDADVQIVEQETILKDALTHAGGDDPKFAKAHLVPLDKFAGDSSPLVDADVDELADRALKQRVEIQQGELSLKNKNLSLMGTRNALLPTLDAYVILQNNALAGRMNAFASAGAGVASPGVIGGFPTLVDQLATRKFPEYQVGFQLNVPLVNRAAQSDLARDQLDLRLQEISQQQLRNGVRLQAMKSALALKQARKQYQLSQQNRKRLEDSLAMEQKMFDFGSSTPEELDTAQTLLEQAQIKEVTALNTYARAQVNLEAVLNQTLEDNQIVLGRADPDSHHVVP